MSKIVLMNCSQRQIINCGVEGTTNAKMKYDSNSCSLTWNINNSQNQRYEKI